MSDKRSGTSEKKRTPFAWERRPNAIETPYILEQKKKKREKEADQRKMISNSVAKALLDKGVDFKHVVYFTKISDYFEIDEIQSLFNAYFFHIFSRTEDAQNKRVQIVEQILDKNTLPDTPFVRRHYERFVQTSFIYPDYELHVAAETFRKYLINNADQSDKRNRERVLAFQERERKFSKEDILYVYGSMEYYQEVSRLGDELSKLFDEEMETAANESDNVQRLRTIEEWLEYINGPAREPEEVQKKGGKGKARRGESKKAGRKTGRPELHRATGSLDPELEKIEDELIERMNAELEEKARKIIAERKTFQLRYAKDHLRELSDTIGADADLAQSSCYANSVANKLTNLKATLDKLIQSDDVGLDELVQAALEGARQHLWFGRQRPQLSKEERQEKFLHELKTAVETELKREWNNNGVYYGRPTGGVLPIRCPRGLWHDVHLLLHDMEVTAIPPRLRIRNAVRPLRRNESYRYYVTARSTSIPSPGGFCVSVHLWRGEVDTFVPCVVLHVPWSS